MRVLALTAAIAGLAIAPFSVPASAAPISVPGSIAGTGTASMLTPASFIIKIGGGGYGGGYCPAGTHLGYEGKYCWPNYGHICPSGTHLGYEGKYCWRN